jgi:hypothetical protein
MIFDSHAQSKFESSGQWAVSISSSKQGLAVKLYVSRPLTHCLLLSRQLPHCFDRVYLVRRLILALAQDSWESERVAALVSF